MSISVTCFVYWRKELEGEREGESDRVREEVSEQETDIIGTLSRRIQIRNMVDKVRTACS